MPEFWEVELCRCIRGFHAEHAGQELVHPRSEVCSEIGMRVQRPLYQALHDVYPDADFTFDSLMFSYYRCLPRWELQLVGAGWAFAWDYRGELPLMPVNIRIQIDPLIDEIAWFLCQLGERNPQGILVFPQRSFDGLVQRAINVAVHGQNSLTWAFSVECGQRCGPVLFEP